MNLPPTLLMEAQIADLPPAAHVVVGCGLALGLLLWIFGNRLLRHLFAALTGVLGCLLGLFLLPALLPESLLGAPSPYVGMGVGAVLGFTVGILLFRFAVAIGFGLVAGIAGVLITGVLMQSPEVNGAAETARLTIPDTPALREAEQLRTLTREDIQQAAAPVESRVREFLREKSDELAAAWAEIPHREQVRLVVAGLASAIGGLLIGLLMPRKSAAACSALLGTAIWLPALGWLLHAIEAPGRELLSQPMLVWLIVWLTLAMLGFAIQIVIIRRRRAAED